MHYRKSCLLILYLVFPLTGNLFADFTWLGNKDSNFQEAGNWDIPPAKDASNAGSLFIGNGFAKALSYTEKEGSTIFNGQLLVGVHSDSSIPGVLTITGGTLTINDSQFGAIVGQTTTGTLNVSGGVLNLTGGHPTFLANEGDGTINLSGGTISVDGDLLIDRNNTINGGNFSGIIKITGGKVLVNGQTSFDVDGGGGAGGTGYKKIEFGLGDGTFIQTKVGTLVFPIIDDAGTAYVNFVTGSKGSLSLNGATKDYFDGLVKANRIKIDDKPALPSDFNFMTSGGQGVYKLSH
jgi:hypothetical protein